ncbi:MAG: hypothetical protein PHY56_04695, partial [Candidatus Omnitrophica bacterium]|nr:hypothetical protein [Candidatus Omnitrophota bacterium]
SQSSRREIGLRADQPIEDKDSQQHYPFAAGEKLKYFIYSAGIKVGEFNITYLGRKDFKDKARDVILAEAQAPGFIDREEIYGSIETFSPVRVERNIRLFGENINIVEEYDENTNEALITRKARNTTTQRIISEDKISNIMLLLYHFRYKKNEYRIGEKFGFNLPTQKLEMLIDKITTINVPKGRFQALFVKSAPARFKVWLRSEDMLPLRIQGAIGFGNTYLDLKEIE